MKRPRAAHLFLLPALLLNPSFILAAHADCRSDLQAVQAQMTAVKDQSHRQELQKLLEKAQKDDKSGRVNLCDQAVQRARTLLK